MLKPRNIAEARLETPSVSVESSDTTITVNNGGGRVLPRPELRSPVRTVETTERVPNQTYIHNTVTTPGSPQTSTSHRINWGGVVKGAAIVTGVVLAGVVAFYAVPAALTSLGVIGPGGLLTGVINAVAPAVAWVGDIAVSSALFVAHFVESAAVAVFGGLGLGGTGAAAATVSTGAVSSATGALAAGGAVAVGVPVAAKAVMATPMVDTVHTTSVSAPVLTGMEDGGAAQHSAGHAHAAAAHGQVQAAHAPHGSHGHGNGEGHLSDMQDVPDMHEQLNAVKNASKMAHHAAHSAEGHETAEMPETAETVESRTRSALRNSARTSQVWAERVGGQARQKSAVAPRASDYATQLADERAQLDAALDMGRA